MVERNIPTAADIMARKLITLQADSSVLTAMRTLVENQISGAPVLDEQGRLCGILSELDCMRILTSGQFSQDSHDEDAQVRDVMTRNVETIGPDLDLFGIAQRFLSHKFRRLPVLENGRMIGMVSRRNVLVGVEKMRREMRSKPADRVKRGLYLSARDADPGSLLD